MAANTDKFRKVAGNFSTTLSSAIDDVATTIPLASASGLPTDTAVTLIIDRVDANGDEKDSSNWELVTGVISGNNLTNALRGEGGTTAQSHDAGAVVEAVIDEEWANDLIDGILAEHDQSGAHTTDTIIPTVKTATLASDYTSTDTGTYLDTGLSITFTDAEIPVNGKIIAFAACEVKDSAAQSVVAGIGIGNPPTQPQCFNYATIDNANKRVSITPILVTSVTGGNQYIVKVFGYQPSAGTYTLIGGASRSRLIAIYIPRAQ